jgi:hypothetical protein
MRWPLPLYIVIVLHPNADFLRGDRGWGVSFKGQLINPDKTYRNYLKNH